MRWTSQTVEEEERSRLPGYRDDAVVRRFDAPEALETRFYEVHAKSALNRVPNASRVPFEWTINPYRGCTHACLYCIHPATPILLSSGRTKAIGDLEVGDAIYGTVRRGNYRRYAVTEVLAKWSTVKPAYRVELEDGTELVASGDHRFLTRRGWKHVNGAEQGALGRPHLTRTDSMLGTGAFANGPVKRDLAGTALKSDAPLRVVDIQPLGVDLPLIDITTGTGDFIANGVVSHNCFARPTHEYLGFDAGRDFDREIVVKVNVPEVLRAELARPSWKRQHVALGTNTDPYQWVEGRYKLMRGIWQALRDAANPCSILTKSPLVLRDADLLCEIAERATVTACLSVPTLDEKAWRATEPHTPHPRARLEAVAELNRRGIPTGILIAPLMPGINDAPEQVEPIIALAQEAGAVSIGGTTLFLRGSTRDVFFGWLRGHRPDLVERYEELYRRGAYVPESERRTIERAARLPGKRLRPYAERFDRGGPRSPSAPATPPAREPPAAPAQGALF